MHFQLVVLNRTLMALAVLLPVLSLGVIFFEMCVRFATGMERAMVLTGTANNVVMGAARSMLMAYPAFFLLFLRLRRDAALRRPAIQFPPVFDRALMVNEAKLIRQMLQHDPKLRPSAADILKRCGARPRLDATNVRSHGSAVHRSAMLLTSDLLPPPEEDFITEAIRVITDPKSPYHGRLLEGAPRQAHNILQDAGGY